MVTSINKHLWLMLLAGLGYVCSAQLDLSVTPDPIIQGLSDTLNVNCTFTKTVEETYDVSILIKFRPDNTTTNYTNIASINAFTHVQRKYQTDWEVSGSLGDTDSYLILEKNRPSREHAGEYVCQAVLFRSFLPGETTTLMKNVTVAHKDPTIDALAEEIGKMKEQLKDIESLKEEVQRFKNNYQNGYYRG